MYRGCSPNAFVQSPSVHHPHPNRFCCWSCGIQFGWNHRCFYPKSLASDLTDPLTYRPTFSPAVNDFSSRSFVTPPPLLVGSRSSGSLIYATVDWWNWAKTSVRLVMPTVRTSFAPNFVWISPQNLFSHSGVSPSCSLLIPRATVLLLVIWSPLIRWCYDIGTELKWNCYGLASLHGVVIFCVLYRWFSRRVRSWFSRFCVLHNSHLWWPDAPLL